MTWEYRVLTRDGELAIYEVYYYPNGGIEGYSALPVFPTGANLEELKNECDLYMAALKKPILNYE